MNLIITPVYRSYKIVAEMAEAIDKFTVNPYLHILVDDDSNLDEPFPVKPSSNRRILMMKRDYEGTDHRTGEGQAIQLGLDWANQPVFNGEDNPIPYDHTFMIEADVIVKEGWDEKMINLIPTLPRDWLTLDVQSTDFQDRLIYPTTNWGSKVGDERLDLEITYYPDFQCTLFNQRLFDAGISFSSLIDPCDSLFGRGASNLLNGRHFRTKTVSVYHYVSQSIRFLEKIVYENLVERVTDIDSFISNEDIKIYHKYGSGLKDGSIILDVGTGRAKSAICLALTNPKNKVITADDGSDHLISPKGEEYIKKIEETIKNHGVDNCEFIYESIFNLVDTLPPIDLFHLDDEDLEGDILEKVFPLVKKGGILLVRNYLRFRDIVDRVCKNCEYIEYGGLIQVIRK